MSAAAAIWSVVRLIRAPSADTALLALVGVGLLGTVFAARRQALTVQNRLIRLEMTLRFPRVLPPELAARTHELTLGYVIALRFAGDGELADLVRRALAGEFKSPALLKRAIRDWQPDLLRA